MTAINLLFVCARNQWRSPTAAKIHERDPRYNVRARGLRDGSPRKLTAADLAWADVVFVMERRHRRMLLDAFGEDLGEAPLYVLDIPDDFGFMDPDLVDLLRRRVDARLAE